MAEFKPGDQRPVVGLYYLTLLVAQGLQRDSPPDAPLADGAALVEAERIVAGLVGERTV